MLAVADIAGVLFDIAAGRLKRTSEGQITLFKSVGHAIEDLAGAVALWRRVEAGDAPVER